ncbi:MAG: helix-turn-helix transcriptional regulator, partial [Candidatus Limnocylindrales bacterium]
MTGYAKQAALDRIARLARQHHDLATFWRESSAAIASAVPNYQGPCWYTLDPASLLVTSHVNEHMPELPPQWLASEYYDDEVNKLSDVARSERGISTLHEATGGDPSLSPRWQANIAYGGDQEMIAALRTPAGHVWGALGLYRETGKPLFDAQEQRFILEAAPHLAEGARRALLVGEASDPEGPDAPGLVVLSDRWEVESTTPGVEHSLSDLPDGDWQAGKLPSAVLSVAGRALRTAERPDEPGEIAVARVLARSGMWVVLHGVSLVSGGSRRVAVIVEPAHPARISPLLMSAYGLTEREQDVTQLVLQGNSTLEIAERLVVSAHTVQQHLKSVFDKTGVRSRRDLVGKVFF